MIYVKESPSADTRSAKEKISKEILKESSMMHIEDVTRALRWFCYRINQISMNHDFTKIADIDKFYEDFSKCQENPKENFCHLEWYKNHIQEERHHLDKRVPKDVNLFDVLEHIADIVMAGMARKGEVYFDSLPNGVMQKAYYNTILRLKEQVRVEKIKQEKEN